MSNPLLEPTDRIPFDVIEAAHVGPAVDRLIGEAQAAVEAIASGPSTYEATLGALERATEGLEFALGVVGHLEAVATSSELREAYNEVRPKAAALFSSITLNAPLYRALEAFAATDEAASLDPTRKRFLDKTLADFRRNGAALDADGKARIAAIDVELATLTTTFSQNVLDATNAWTFTTRDESRLAGLPKSAKAAAAQAAEASGETGYRFTLQAPSYLPVMTYADDAALRQMFWRAYATRASEGEHDNTPALARILELRAEKAALLGFANFADLVLEDRMAGTGARAVAFLDELREKSRAAFEAENASLSAFRLELEGAHACALEPWDIAYYAERQRRALFDFDAERLRPYFEVERTLAGLFDIASRLYGVRIEPVDDMPTWHESVRTYAITEADGTRLAAFYADLYPRETKRGGAWMHGLRSGVVRSGAAEPHLGLICGNLNPPVGDMPALLTHADVETLFHEFGHLLHHCLSRVSVRSLAGANVAWDFVELPSQIMENWAWAPESLALFARHHERGEPIPEALFESLQRARTFRAANAMMRQLGFGAVDLALHAGYDPKRDGDALAFGNRVLAAHAPTVLPDDYAMLLGFTHLFASPVGYAAGYYSYKWAEVLDADAFSRFAAAGVLSAETGAAFRRDILARGDAEDPMALFQAFMGREPRVEPLLERSGLLPAAA